LIYAWVLCVANKYRVKIEIAIFGTAIGVVLLNVVGKKARFMASRHAQ